MRSALFLGSLLCLLPISFFAQGIQTYEGPFENGEAIFEYTEKDMHEKIMNGKFSYTETRHIQTRGGEHEVLITGNFKEDKKHLTWAITIKPTDATTGLTETIIGNYSDGERSGLWTHRVVDNTSNEEIKLAKVSYIKNHFRGPFRFNFQDSNAVDMLSLAVKGTFDNEGLTHGTWILKYTNGVGTHFRDSLIYVHGVLGYRKRLNSTEATVIEEVDELALANSFFVNMNKADSFSVLEGEKYGLRATKMDHPILKPLFTTWMNLYANEIGNAYNAPLPLVYFKRGETRNPGLLYNTMKIIPWKDTPKGKKEYEEKLAQQQAYDTKIGVADFQFQQKNYRQANKLYREAVEIKPEPYAQDQIKKVEEFIRLEKEKQQLLTAVSSREELWKGNNTMLEAESYYGKKGKLYEASQRALIKMKQDLLSEYRDTRTLLIQERTEELTNDQLEEYQARLDEAIAFQELIKKISKREDTKDLEKELKKMEDPSAIITRIKQE